MRHLHGRRSLPFATSFALGLLLACGCLASEGGVTFHDVASQEGSGLVYERTPSETFASQLRINAQPAMNMGHVIASPEKPRGAPGVALIDFDLDGDLDLYVTNGPGSANSLFANRRLEQGKLVFEDVAAKAGVEATTQDSTGVCFGDTDNDGDPDLLVLGRSEPNRFFENRGDGTFVEKSVASGLAGDDQGHASCSMGDYDNDGLLDVAVANSFNWITRPAVFSVPYAESHPNNLYRNLGGNRFTDVSESVGIRAITSVRPEIDAGATMTWAIALVDYDGDGDLDLVHADDQAAMDPRQADRAHLQIFRNDGNGHFDNVTTDAGTGLYGAWMGIAFADFNCDGRLDMFATNWGDYAYDPIEIPFERGDWSSRAFLGADGGKLKDAGVGELRATPFGWSPVALDYDNDADTDVIYYGALGTAIYTILGDNPGAVLENPGCTAAFRRDADALTKNHNRRIIEGAAAGDLDGDGFPDLVSVASFRIPESVPAKPYKLDYGSPFDESAVYYEFLQPAPGGNFIPKGIEFPNGDLAVEINSGNSNHWAAVRTLGTFGLVAGGAVNRDGIGALLSFTPEGKPTSTRPVLGGANYASQDSLETLFGFGDARRGTLDVLWPGGVRNRLDGVRAGERLVMPEIPCGYDAEWSGPGAYEGCVDTALAELRQARVIDAAMQKRLRDSALAAYADAHRDDHDDRDELERPRVREERPAARGANLGVDGASLRALTRLWLG
ncbi:MAG TPA: CRTAC1 family protein [Thermoanaerobaculia bacterium]|nr:CRTAC1 family protein [Thermoanaerobaculia bacterium]